MLPRFTCLVMLAGVVLSACETDLGPCDDAAARTVYYSAAGTPSYGGQALTATYCALKCHSVTASGSLREGVPAELDFDMLVAGDDPALIERLRAGQAKLFEWRAEASAWVEAGTMPPAGQPRSGANYEDVSGVSLPGLDEPEGQEMFRNWLACGLPVVERSEPASGGQSAGDQCSSGQVGDCVVSRE